MTALSSLLQFLISIFFDTAILLCWLRIALRFFRVSYAHPLNQVVYKLTQVPLVTLDKIIYPRHIPQYDGVSFMMILVLTTLKLSLLGSIIYHQLLPLNLLLLVVMGSLVITPCNLLFYALIIRVITSYLSPIWQKNMLFDFINLITNPLIRIGHRIIPNISGFDFSPFIMLISLKILSLCVSACMPLPLV